MAVSLALGALRLLSSLPQGMAVFPPGVVARHQQPGCLSAMQSQMWVQRHLRYQGRRFQQEPQERLAQG